MASRLNPTNHGYQNFYSAVLTGDITSGTLAIGLDTVPTPSEGILIIDPDSTTSREVILYTSKGASTVTCPSDGRGYSGSTATAHLQGTTVIMAANKKWFDSLASGELSTDPIRTEAFSNFVSAGLIWTGDAYASTRNASMTSGVLYILGRRLTLAAVTAHTFTASKDTYVDVADNGDGTGLITYNEVNNGSASPALTTNNVRIAKIVTAAGSIAAASSITQPGNDSLGNIIYPKGAISTANIQNPYKFRVYLNQVQNHVNGTFTKVNLNTEEFDTNNNYDPVTNYRYTAPVSGYYYFSAAARTDAGTANIFSIAALYVNGVVRVQGAQYTSASGFGRSVVSDLMPLKAGDYVELFFRVDTGANSISVGSLDTYLSGFLVSAS